MKTIKIKYKDLPKNTHTPILTYCRQLIKEGEDPEARLEVYRNSKDWDISITEIGLGAKLTIKDNPNIHIVPFIPFKMAN